MTVCPNCGGATVHEVARSGAQQLWLDRCTVCQSTFNETPVIPDPTPVRVMP